MNIDKVQQSNIILLRKKNRGYNGRHIQILNKEKEINPNGYKI